VASIKRAELLTFMQAAFSMALAFHAGKHTSKR